MNRDVSSCLIDPSFTMSSSTTEDCDINTNTVCSVKIHSNWHSTTGDGLENTLVVQEDSGEDIDPTQFMSTDTCAFLTKEGEDVNQSLTDNCCITLQTSGSTVISSLSILSEARILEVHGPCEEYLKTIKAEFLLEVEGTTVYCADIKIDHPCNYLLIKLTGLSRANDLWLYGLHVRWKVDSHRNDSLFSNTTQLSPFNLEAVDRRLNEIGQDLSANAQQYKKVLCSLKGRGDTGDTQAMKPFISNLVSSFLQGGQLNKREAASNSSPAIEVLLDLKLRELETHILNEVDKRIQEMEKRQQAFINEGFEKIMKQLQLGFNMNTDKPPSTN